MAKSNKKAVVIVFNGLTTNGKVYSKGEVEKNPNEYLIQAARDKTKQFHRDEGRQVRLAKFVRLDDDIDDLDDDIEETKPTRIPVVAEEPEEEVDDLNEMTNKALMATIRNLGLRKDFAQTLNREQKIKFSRFMRRL